MTKNDFYIKTFANFKGCKTPFKTPDFISNSGSKYWYGQDKKGEFVIRFSDHWSNVFSETWKGGSFINKKIAGCWWNLKASFGYDSGKCYFKDFKSRT